jgi:quercetin dioxygenase-like cupin family protein
MKTLHTIAGATLIAAVSLSTMLARGEEVRLGSVTRTDLLRENLSIAGREVIQVLVEFAPGVMAPEHSHPGEEIVYVVEGLLEYVIDGKPPVTLKAGETLIVPYGVTHSAKNVGSGNAAELATYIVEIGKPLVVLGE